LGGDLFVGEAVEVAQHDDLAAAVGQITDGGGEHFQFLLLVDGLGGVGAVFDDRERGEVSTPSIATTSCGGG